jgi:hypothetical protein
MAAPSPFREAEIKRENILLAKKLVEISTSQSRTPHKPWTQPPRRMTSLNGVRRKHQQDDIQRENLVRAANGERSRSRMQPQLHSLAEARRAADEGRVPQRLAQRLAHARGTMNSRAVPASTPRTRRVEPLPAAQREQHLQKLQRGPPEARQAPSTKPPGARLSPLQREAKGARAPAVGSSSDRLSQVEASKRSSVAAMYSAVADDREPADARDHPAPGDADVADAGDADADEDHYEEDFEQ